MVNSTDQNVMCLQQLWPKMVDSALLSDLSSSDITTLTDVFNVVKLYNTIHEQIWLSYRNESFAEFCSSKLNSKILQQLCFTQYTKNKQVIKYWEYSINNNFLINVKWFQRLWKMFQDSSEWSKATISSELQKLFIEIPKYNQYDEQFIKKVYKIVYENIVKMEVNVTCSQITSTTYKLQIKGNFIHLGAILRNHQCPGEIELIEVFSSYKIIIDENINNDKQQLNIISPVWEIIFERFVYLSDTDRRKEGKFFAISGETINGNYLQISTRLSSLHNVLNQIAEREILCYSFGQLYYLKNYSYNDIQSGLSETIMRDEFKTNRCSENITHLQNSNAVQYFIESFKGYKTFILTEILKLTCTHCAQVYLNLNSNKYIPTNYNTVDFTNELIALEKYYSVERNETLTLMLFKSWNEQFRNYHLHQLKSQNELIQRKLLLSLDTMISRKIEKLESKFYNNPIFLIETYLMACIDGSKKLKDVEIVFHMRSITNRYSSEFTEEIKKADLLISSNLIDYLDKRLDDLKVEMQEVVKAIDKVIESKKQDNKDLIKLREKLQEQRALLALFALLKLIALSLTFINPVCAVIGAGLSVGINMIESSTTGAENSKIVMNSMRRNYASLKELKLTTDTNIYDSKRSVNTVNNYADVAGLFVETEKKITKQASKIDEVNYKIEQNLKDIKNLESYKTEIHEKMEPFIERIHSEIMNQTGNFHKLSITYLEYERWHMDDLLSDVSKEIKKWTDLFSVTESAVEKLKKAIQTTIRLHTLIREMKYKISEAQFISNIAAVPHQITNIQDVDLKNRVTDLMHIHYANDIIDEYRKWVHSFRQYIFPFIYKFSEINNVEIFNTFNLVDKANILIEKLIYFKSYLIQKRAEGEPKFQKANFGSDAPLPPFYTWTSSRHSTEIQDILEGEDVQLFADIHDFTHLNAVKFRDINILFTSTNSTLNEELKEDLLHFSVELTHNGDSYYRCDNDLYKSNSNYYKFPKKFFMSQEKIDAGHQTSDYVLSPYATWNISLWNNMGKGNYSVLSKYIGKVDVKLVGDGAFVTDEVDCSRVEL